MAVQRGQAGTGTLRAMSQIKSANILREAASVKSGNYTYGSHIHCSTVLGMYHMWKYLI
ncbi:hypothetical protein [Rhizobium leguminosarum]